MNLRQLELFITIAAAKSFSKGAEAAAVTQSTASQNILAMEEEFGIRLFDRTGKGALLTEGGKVLLEKAQRLLNYAAEIPAAIDRFKGVAEAKLTIAGSSIPGDYLIPAALPLLIQRHPGLDIALMQGDSQQVHEWVLSEQAEIGVSGGYFSGEGLEMRHLCDDEIVLVVPKDHRWTGRAKLQVDELLTEPLILREEGSGTGQYTLRALHNAGIATEALRKAAILGSNHAVTRAVIAGAGAAFVSSISVKDELAQGSLVCVPLENATIVRKFFLSMRKGRELSPAARVFAGVMQELYGNTP